MLVRGEKIGYLSSQLLDKMEQVKRVNKKATAKQKDDDDDGEEEEKKEERKLSRKVAMNPVN